MRPRAARASFTLVEILASLAVVAILASLALAGFSRAAEAARETQCVSRLSQIGSGMLLYAGDHDGTFPPGWTTQRHITWQDDLTPFLRLGDGSAGSSGGALTNSFAKVQFNCPAVPLKYLMTAYTYAPNRNLTNVSNRLPSVARPSRCVMVGETIVGNFSTLSPITGAGPGTVAFRHPGPSAQPLPVTTDAAGRHYGTGRSNFVFCDGHVETLWPAQAVQSSTNDIWTP